MDIVSIGLNSRSKLFINEYTIIIQAYNILKLVAESAKCTSAATQKCVIICVVCTSSGVPFQIMHECELKPRLWLAIGGVIKPHKVHPSNPHKLVLC